MSEIWNEFKWLITTLMVLIVLAIIALIVLRCTGVIGPNSKFAQRKAQKVAASQIQTPIGEPEVSNGN